MNFFNIGPVELILILVVALIVFGPGRLPEIGAGLGKALREFQLMSQGLTEELNRELRATQEAARLDQPDSKPTPSDESSDDDTSIANNDN
jgi:sec-independent protein translocase protein TatA